MFRGDFSYAVDVKIVRDRFSTYHKDKGNIP